MQKKITKQSLRVILENYLQKNPNKWIHGGTIERVGQYYGYEAETARRQMRLMVNKNPNIKKGYSKGCVCYKWT